MKKLLFAGIVILSIYFLYPMIRYEETSVGKWDLRFDRFQHVVYKKNILVQKVSPPNTGWSSILSDPEFQAQSWEVKQRVAHNYFNKHIASDPTFITQPQSVQENVQNNFFNTLITPAPSTEGKKEDSNWIKTPFKDLRHAEYFLKNQEIENIKTDLEDSVETATEDAMDNAIENERYDTYDPTMR